MSAWCVKCNIYIEIFIVNWLTLCSPVDITEGEDVNIMSFLPGCL